jgi:hypothetical protein
MIIIKTLLKSEHSAACHPVAATEAIHPAILEVAIWMI